MSNFEWHYHKFSTGDNIKSINKTQTIETKTTKLNSTSGSGIRTPLVLELGPVTTQIMTITIPEVSQDYNIFLL